MGGDVSDPTRTDTSVLAEVGVTQVKVHPNRAGRRGKKLRCIQLNPAVLSLIALTTFVQESGFSGRCGYEEGSESGKKKVPPTSLNHLLNFTVTSSERQYSGRGGMPPILRHRRRNTSHSYNKEEFLQAK